MKAVVVYDTRYGNTEEIAREIARSLKAELVKARDADASKLKGYDTFVFGSPTHAWNMSKPMKDLFRRMDSLSFSGKKAAVFDTKFKGRFAGSAARKMEGRLRALGFTVAMPYTSFYVTGKEGPLAEGELDKVRGFSALK